MEEELELGRVQTSQVALAWGSLFDPVHMCGGWDPRQQKSGTLCMGLLWMATPIVIMKMSHV